MRQNQTASGYWPQSFDAAVVARNPAAQDMHKQCAGVCTTLPMSLQELAVKSFVFNIYFQVQLW
jgi:hypothetical protein